MLRLVSSKGHNLTIESDTFTVEPNIDIADIVHQNKHDKTQLLAALSMVDENMVWAVEYDSELQARPPTFDYCLSVVSIAPDAHKEAVNQIAELYGCGSNNLSVKLQGEDGIYWGCHSWWKPEDYAQFSDAELRAQIVPAELQPALEHLYERLMLDGDAKENWQTALSELGLVVVMDDGEV